MTATATATRIHVLKTWPSYFAEIVAGRKRFEIRVNDRDFARGDVLRLKEWDPTPACGNATGRVFDVRVTYIAQGVFGMPPLLCVMSIDPIDHEPRYDMSA